MKVKDFEKGNTVYALLAGNAARGKKDDELIQEWEVVAVGRKYVTAKSKTGVKKVKFEESKYSYHGGLREHTDKLVDYILFKDRKQVEEILERDYLEHWLRTVFNKHLAYYSLDQLRKVKEILSKGTY